MACGRHPQRHTPHNAAGFRKTQTSPATAARPWSAPPPPVRRLHESLVARHLFGGEKKRLGGGLLVALLCVQRPIVSRRPPSNQGVRPLHVRPGIQKNGWGRCERKGGGARRCVFTRDGGERRVGADLGGAVARHNECISPAPRFPRYTFISVNWSRRRMTGRPVMPGGAGAGAGGWARGTEGNLDESERGSFRLNQLHTQPALVVVCPHPWAGSSLLLLLRESKRTESALIHAAHAGTGPGSHGHRAAPAVQAPLRLRRELKPVPDVPGKHFPRGPNPCPRPYDLNRLAWLPPCPDGTVPPLNHDGPPKNRSPPPLPSTTTTHKITHTCTRAHAHAQPP